MNKKDLENSIKTYKEILSDIEKFDQQNRKIAHDWEADNSEKIIAALKQDGVNVKNLDVRCCNPWNWKDDSRVEITLTWKLKVQTYNAEVTANFRGSELEDFRIAGFSGKGNELEEVASYYWMVNGILQDLRHPLPTFAALVNEGFGKPEYRDWEGMPAHEVREHIKELEQKIALIDLDLNIDSVVEIFIPGKSRWERDHWAKGTVIAITAKNYKIAVSGWNYMVKHEEATDRLRPITQ